MKKLFICFFTVLLVVVFGSMSMANDPFTTLPSGLEFKDLRVGSGTEARPGATAVIHFVGWLSDNGQRGKEFFNSRKERQPISFKIGTDKVMQGWNEGVIGMQPGGRRMVRIPPELGYGAKAVDGVVPANAHLIFIIELLELK
jgi:peptidylprolyl isomerase